MSMNVQNVLSANIFNLQSNALYTVIVSARGSDKALGDSSNISVTTSKRDAWTTKLSKFILEKKI